MTLLKSLILTAGVAAAFSFFLLSFGINFFQSFIALIVIQFIFFYFYGEYLKRKNAKLTIEAELRLAEENSKQTTVVTCPCDRNIETVIPINLNSDNNYMCPGCNKNISVFITTKTALATTPVTVNPLEGPIFMESLDKIINKSKK